MSGDMLSRIKRRNQRPTVERDTSLGQASESAESVQPAQPLPLSPALPSTPAASAPKEVVSSHSASHASSQLAEREPTQSVAAGATALEAELATLPQVSARRNIRLEIELEKRLLSFCQQNNITVETFVEACFVEVEQNARLRTDLAADAKHRLKLRKQAGKLRRVLSQLKNG